MAYANPFIALILALSMLFSSGAIGTGDFTPFAVEMESNGETVSFGMAETTQGAPAAYLSHDDETFYLTGEKSVLVGQSGAAYTPTQELSALLGTSMGLLPTPTEADLNALTYLFTGLMANISPNALSFAPTGNGFTFKADVDLLLDDLETAVPQVLNAYADQLYPLVRKYSVGLTGQTFTCAQLAAAWPQLGLSQIQTGVTLQLTVAEQETGNVTILGKVCDATFIGSLREDGFNVRFNAPDGKSYQIDTADLAVLAQLLGDLPQQLIAQSVTMTIEGNTQTTTILVNTPVLARTLNQELARIVRENTETVDALLNKYRSWFELADAEVGANLTAERLAMALTAGIIELPEVVGSLSVVQDDSDIAVINGRFTGDMGVVTITGTAAMDDYTEQSITYTITSDSGEGAPFMVTCTGHFAEDNETLTYTFSEPVFGLFRTLNFAFESYAYYDFYGRTEEEFIQELYDEYYAWSFYQDYYGSVEEYIQETMEYYLVSGTTLSVTTDTDEVRLCLSDEPRCEIKLPDFYFFFGGETEGRISLQVPEFYLDFLFTDNGMRLDTPVFGLSVNEYGLDGYVAEDYDRVNFGFQMNEDGILTHAYILGGDLNYSLTNIVDGDTILLGIDDEAYFLNIVDDNTFTVTNDGEVVYTLKVEVNADHTTETYRLYNGANTSAQPMFTVTVDLDPDAVTLPAFCQMVDAEDFLQLLGSFLN